MKSYYLTNEKRNEYDTYCKGLRADIESSNLDKETAKKIYATLSTYKKAVCSQHSALEMIKSTDENIKNIEKSITNETNQKKLDALYLKLQDANAKKSEYREIATRCETQAKLAEGKVAEADKKLNMHLNLKQDRKQEATILTLPTKSKSKAA